MSLEDFCTAARKLNNILGGHEYAHPYEQRVQDGHREAYKRRIDAEFEEKLRVENEKDPELKRHLTDRILNGIYDNDDLREKYKKKE